MSSQKKRVYNLYRVSTLKQIEKEDIPMQRIICREFVAQHPDWVLEKEFMEKGVSGFKVSAKDRDVIQEIQQAAVNKEFDILLVFMFDRIGRIDDETPFIVEWFVKNGIEVWSTQEGQQRFDNHVDKLMNYIRYWQASGESIKTSVRTKTRLGQIIQERRFRGGIPPYGYRLEKQGRRNKRGHEVWEILVDEEEAAVVKHIYELYLNRGYGSKRICTYLEENKIKNRAGTNFVNCTIQHMLKNETYTGILKSGETKSEIFSELQIIDPDTFQEVQEMLTQRSNAYKERNLPRHTKGQGLLSGNLYCGHCGARLVQTSNTKRNFNADGSPGKEYVRIRYVCYNKTRHKHLCDGQTGYTVHKVDAIIDQIIHNLFDQAKDTPQSEILDVRYHELNKTLEANLKAAEIRLKKQQKELEAYKAEMLLVIRGESVLDRETLNELLTASKKAVEESTAEVEKCTAELQDRESTYDELRKSHENLLTWVDMYDHSSLEVRKMIVSRIIQQVRIKRNYEMEIDFNISYQDYCSGGASSNDRLNELQVETA